MFCPYSQWGPMLFETMLLNVVLTFFKISSRVPN